MTAKKLIANRNQPMDILQKPNPILSRECDDVDISDQDELMRIIRALNASLASTKYGMKLGMAAPQIGISKRIFIYKSRGSLKVCINPEWRPSAAPMTDRLEGCYSLKEGDLYKVSRNPSGFAHYQGVNGRWIEEKLNGADANVYQHELSHLEGKCCDDLGELVQSAEPNN
jgi:peptide deformylase